MATEMDRVEALARLEPDFMDQLLRALNINPGAVRHTVGTLAIEPISMEPVTDYITDINERCHLFRELQRIFQGGYLRASELNASMLSFVMVAPISEIKESLSAIHLDDILLMNVRASYAVRSYLPKGRPQTDLPPTPRLTVPASILGPPDSPNDITRGGGEQAKIRDGNTCVFSGMGDPAAAHIFPFATSAKRDFYNLNQLLQVFWGADKSMDWRRCYEEAGITQSPKNYISMNHQLHFWFHNARFALKPLRRVHNGIVLQFHWLRKTPLRPRTKIRTDLDILVQAELTDYKRWGTNLAHRRSGAPIETGQTFIIRADDPEVLPSLELLELQWNLLRVAAICGAADATDEDYEKDDEEDEEEVILDSIREQNETVHGLKSPD